MREGRRDMVGVRTALIDTPAMDWSLREPTPAPLMPLPPPAAAAPTFSATTLFLAVAMAFVATFCSIELDDDTWLATALLASLAVTLLVLLEVLFFFASRSTLETQLVFFAVTPEEGASPDPAEASLPLPALLLLVLVLVVAEAAAAASLGAEEAACSLGAGGIGLTALLDDEEEEEVEEDAGEGVLSLKLSGVGGASPCSGDGPDCFRLLPWDAPPTSLFFNFIAVALAAACLATAETEEVVPSIQVTGLAVSALVDD